MIIFSLFLVGVGGECLKSPPFHSVFGYITKDSRCDVIEGPLEGQSFPLRSGSWIASPYRVMFEDDAGFFVFQRGGKPHFQVGYTEEEEGRYDYIDGIKESLLVPPTERGGACLHSMSLPPLCVQTEHSHPDSRCIFVTKGEGFYTEEGKETAVKEGDFFTVAPHTKHFFQAGKEGCSLVTWHPSSQDSTRILEQETIF